MGGCSSSSNQTNKDNGLRIKGTNPTEKEQTKPIEAKIVLLGEQYVGKSSIAQRFCKNLFTGQYVVTIGGAYLQQKIVLSNGVTIKFHIWDTGGQERFRSMANLYYRDASAAILVYDVSNEKSFENINYWVEELNTKCDSDKLVLALAGNKCDIESNEKKIQSSFSKNYAEKNNMIFYETSAKNDIGIKDLFNALAKKIYEVKSLNSGIKK